AAVIDVDPDGLDPEPGHVAETKVRPGESRFAVDPGFEDAVPVTRRAVLAERVQLAVHRDAVPAVVLQGRVDPENVALLALHVGVVAVVADSGGVGAWPLEVAARGPAVGAVDLAAAPAGLTIGAGNARELAAVGSAFPVRVELQVIAEVDFFRLVPELLAE